MQRIEYRTRDKSDWPRGEWDNEPDKIQWQDQETGLPCLLLRNSVGALCGYVGVSSGHPLHGKEYDYPDVNVHGGLTFSDSCSLDPEESRNICHRPDPGEPDDVWWFGFDCAHAFDRTPASERFVGIHRIESDRYRNVAYVEAQCADLARQLKALTQG